MIRNVNPGTSFGAEVIREELRSVGLSEIIRTEAFDDPMRGRAYLPAPGFELLRHFRSWTLLGDLPEEARSLLPKSAGDRLRHLGNEFTTWTLDEFKTLAAILIRFVIPRHVAAGARK